MDADMRQNTAAWIDAPYAELTVREAPMPTPAPSQLLVEVRALAVNPLDAIIQSNGAVMYGWLRYPVILGEDVAGVVVGIGPGIDTFAVGDRVVAYAIGLEKGRDAVGESGFQATSPSTRTLPPGCPTTCSSRMPRCCHWRVDGSSGSLRGRPARAGLLRLGGGGAARGRRRGVGRATAVGGNAIQLARAAAIASSRRHPPATTSR